MAVVRVEARPVAALALATCLGVGVGVGVGLGLGLGSGLGLGFGLGLDLGLELGLGLELRLGLGLGLGSGLEHAEAPPVDRVAVTLIEDELGREILGRAAPATHRVAASSVRVAASGACGVAASRARSMRAWPHNVHVAPVTSLANPKSASLG